FVIAAAPAFTVQPSRTPDRVALSVSSASPAALSPLSVIGPSSLPLHTVVAPNTGSSATPLAVTLRTSTALVPAPSAVLTVSVRNALSPPWSSSEERRVAKEEAANPAPLASTAAPSLTDHPAGTPDRVALSVSSASPAALSLVTGIGPTPLPCHSVVAPNTGSSATPLAVTLRISTALVPAPSAVLTVSVRNALSPPWS